MGPWPPGPFCGLWRSTSVYRATSLSVREARHTQPGARSESTSLRGRQGGGEELKVIFRTRSARKQLLLEAGKLKREKNLGGPGRDHKALHTCLLGPPECRVSASDATAKHWASRVEFTDADTEDLDAQRHENHFLLWWVQAVCSLLSYVGVLIRSRT